MDEPANQHGRKAGRGLRPWLLIPKLLCIGMVFGGFVAAAVLAITTTAKTPAEFATLLDAIGHVVVWCVVPGLIGSILFGAMLWWQHPKELGSRRWLHVKLFIVAAILPAMHVWVSGMMDEMRDETAAAQPAGWRRPELWGQFRFGVVLAIVVVIGLIILGRHKPRLGQGSKPPLRPGPPIGEQP
jgi:uncharacterized membrane protein